MGGAGILFDHQPSLYLQQRSAELPGPEENLTWAWDPDEKGATVLRGYGAERAGFSKIDGGFLVKLPSGLFHAGPLRYESHYGLGSLIDAQNGDWSRVLQTNAPFERYLAGVTRDDVRVRSLWRLNLVAVGTTRV